MHTNLYLLQFCLIGSDSWLPTSLYLIIMDNLYFIALFMFTRLLGFEIYNQMHCFSCRIELKENWLQLQIFLFS